MNRRTEAFRIRLTERQRNIIYTLALAKAEATGDKVTETDVVRTALHKAWLEHVTQTGSSVIVPKPKP